MFNRQFRRLLERYGQELQPLGKTAEIAADRQRLADERRLAVAPRRDEEHLLAGHEVPDQPVQLDGAVDELERHTLHGERYRVEAATWERIRAAPRVLAVGTTTTRTVTVTRTDDSCAAVGKPALPASAHR